MKKIILALAAVLAISAGSAFAADTAVLNDVLTAGTAVINSENATLAKGTDGGYTATDGSVVSFGELGDVIESEMSFNLGSEPSDWIGFQLRAKETDKRCWSNTCYVVIVKANGIEFQYFGAGSGYYASYAYALPQNEKVNVKVGVEPTDKGNYIFITIGDDTFGVYDTEDRISAAGNFCIDGALTGVTFYETAATDYTAPEASVEYDPEAHKLTASSNLEGAAYGWYVSTDEFIYDETTKLVDLEKFELIEDFDTDTLALQENEVGKYAICAAEKDGKRVYSKICYADPAEYVLKHGYVGCVGYSKGVVNGKVFSYSSDGKDYPDYFTELPYLPVRGMCDGLGWEIKWVDELRQVWVYDPNAAAEASFSVDKTGFINFKNLMSAAMLEAPKLVNDRTYLDVYTSSYIYNYKTVIMNESNGAIIMAPIDLELTDDQVSYLADYVTTL